MKTHVLRIALTLTLLGPAGLAAQNVASTASQYAVKDVNRIDSVLASPMDLAAIAREDEENDRQGLPPRYAIPEAVSITPATRGTWESLPDGRMLWRLRILGREGTTSLNLGFSRFQMPAHGSLLLYSADGSQKLRPFTADDNEAHGQLWTPPVLTDDLIVELTGRRARRTRWGSSWPPSTRATGASAPRRWSSPEAATWTSSASLPATPGACRCRRWR